MKRNKLAALIMFLLVITGCRQTPDIPDGSFVAFSLREAQQMLSSQKVVEDSLLTELGGITRLVGMVIDRENHDIILVGKKISNLPKANLEDLVVAMRARLIHDELPMVSIDPVENTKTTGKQEVRFGGQIENTSFGKTFLDCDILLKKYSLELEQKIQGVESYKQLLLNQELNSLLKNGIKPNSIEWVDNKYIDEFIGKTVDSETTSQSRFWFNYKDPFRVRIRDDVFCIMSLDIVVERELQTPVSDAGYKPPEMPAASPDILFANGFSNSYYNLSDAYPVLKKLKLLFDMTALAEGMRQNVKVDELSYLLHDFPVQNIQTQKNFDLIEKCAVIERNDGKTNIISVSGGISVPVELEWLNSGDVGYLRQFVMDSRPTKQSLYWKVPVDEWKMPNSDGIIVQRDNSNKSPGNQGCILNSNSLVLDRFSKAGEKFSTFSYAKPNQDINTKGVKMNMEIDTSSYRHADSLKTLRDKILKSYHEK